ncbi:hypothetical protein [Actinocorallia libanotica]|uniref:Uncharacterized protein n=1 Tax=Actinocorallia libanotica TaxID=46162 RepID=A0ABN1RVR5_9ACTN
MKEHLDHITRQLQQAQARPTLIATAYIGLDLVSRAASALAELCPEPDVPAYQSAILEADEAAVALATAPSLTWPERDYLAALPHHEEFAAQLITLTLAVHQALLLAARKSPHPADRLACLEAALHTARAHQALR